jgi:hypothetical protein
VTTAIDIGPAELAVGVDADDGGAGLDAPEVGAGVFGARELGAEELGAPMSWRAGSQPG